MPSHFWCKDRIDSKSILKGSEWNKIMKTCWNESVSLSLCLCLPFSLSPNDNHTHTQAHTQCIHSYTHLLTSTHAQHMMTLTNTHLHIHAIQPTRLHACTQTHPFTPTFLFICLFPSLLRSLPLSLHSCFISIWKAHFQLKPLSISFFTQKTLQKGNFYRVHLHKEALDDSVSNGNAWLKKEREREREREKER